MPAPSPAALLQAARALLAQECGDSESRADWRFVLAMYAAAEEGRGLSAPETALVAALPERQAARLIAEWVEAGLVAADAVEPPEPPRYRLTPEAAADAALMVEALAAVTPARATAPAPRPRRRRGPPG